MYAETFDRDLVDKLNYQSPRLLAQLIARTVPADARLDILDIGCGTGLMGAGLRALKRTLTGVDLSPNMLEQARRRGLYDRFIVRRAVKRALITTLANLDAAFGGDKLTR